MDQVITRKLPHNYPNLFRPLITLGALGVWTLIDFIFAVAGKMKDKEGNLIENW